MAPPDFFETIPHENYPSFKGVLNYFDDKITATTTEHPPPRLCLITRYAMELRISNGFHTPVVWGKTCRVDSGLKRKHHFNCFIFQKNIRFIAKCFIVSCLIFLSDDAEKEIMRQQDQNTGRLRTSQQSPEKQNRHPREASAGERRYGHSTRPFNRKSSATTGQPQ